MINTDSITGAGININGTTIGTSQSFSNYCSYRLPCGWCKELDKMCPIAGTSITWHTSVAPTVTLGNKQQTNAERFESVFGVGQANLAIADASWWDKVYTEPKDEQPG